AGRSLAGRSLRRADPAGPVASPALHSRGADLRGVCRVVLRVAERCAAARVVGAMSERVLQSGEFRCPKCGKPRFAIERCCDVYASEVQTFWNGEPAPARIVRVIVGPSPVKTWWCAQLAGTERKAVEVNY